MLTLNLWSLGHVCIAFVLNAVPYDGILDQQLCPTQHEHDGTSTDDQISPKF